MSARFGYAIGNGRHVPTVDDYETMKCMSDHGHLDRLSADDAHRARLYLSTPVGELICALHDASIAATSLGDLRTSSLLAALRDYERRQLEAARSPLSVRLAAKVPA